MDDKRFAATFSWNYDETGLFYKAMSSGSLRFAGDEQSNGTKVPKDRLTMLQFTNMDGSEKQVVVVDNSAKPCCFKNAETLPFSHFANHKTWMTSQLFTDVMKTLDRKMIAQNRKIILFWDNAICHNLLAGTNLSNIKLSFMPPNTTSLIQPLDQGIIRSFKVYYRRELVRMQIVAIDATSPVPLSEVAKQITVLKAMHMMKRVLLLVKPSKIQNCFFKRPALSLNHRLKWKKYSTKMIMFLHHRAWSKQILTNLSASTTVHSVTENWLTRTSHVV